MKNTKDTFIDEMLASIITSSDTRLLSSDFVQDYLEAGGREETLKMILKPLFDIYIKSINYKEKEKIIKKEKIPDP